MELEEFFSSSDKSLLLIYHTDKNYFILQGVGKLPPKDLQKVFVRFRVQAKRKETNKLLINFHDVNSFGLRQLMNLFTNYLSKSTKDGNLAVALIIANPEKFSKNLMKVTRLLAKVRFQLFEKMQDAEKWLLEQQTDSISSKNFDKEEGYTRASVEKNDEENGIEYFGGLEVEEDSEKKRNKKEKELKSFSLGKGVKVKFKVVNEKKKWWQYFLE